MLDQDDEAKPGTLAALPFSTVDDDTFELTEYDKRREEHQKLPERTVIQLSGKMLSNELSCPICLDLLTQTMATKECQHRFCSECITMALQRGNKECPTCRKKLVSKRSLRADPNFDALISKLWPDRSRFDASEGDDHVKVIGGTREFKRIMRERREKNKAAGLCDDDVGTPESWMSLDSDDTSRTTPSLASEGSDAMEMDIEEDGCEEKHRPHKEIADTTLVQEKDGEGSDNDATLKGSASGSDVYESADEDKCSTISSCSTCCSDLSCSSCFTYSEDEADDGKLVGSRKDHINKPSGSATKSHVQHTNSSSPTKDHTTYRRDSVEYDSDDTAPAICDDPEAMAEAVDREVERMEVDEEPTQRTKLLAHSTEPGSQPEYMRWKDDLLIRREQPVDKPNNASTEVGSSSVAHRGTEVRIKDESAEESNNRTKSKEDVDSNVTTDTESSNALLNGKPRCKSEVESDKVGDVVNADKALDTDEMTDKESEEGDAIVPTLERFLSPMEIYRLLGRNDGAIPIDLLVGDVTADEVRAYMESQKQLMKYPHHIDCNCEACNPINEPATMQDNENRNAVGSAGDSSRSTIGEKSKEVNIVPEATLFGGVEASAVLIRVSRSRHSSSSGSEFSSIISCDCSGSDTDTSQMGTDCSCNGNHKVRIKDVCSKALMFAKKAVKDAADHLNRDIAGLEREMKNHKAGNIQEIIDEVGSAERTSGGAAQDPVSDDEEQPKNRFKPEPHVLTQEDLEIFDPCSEEELSDWEEEEPQELDEEFYEEGGEYEDDEVGYDEMEEGGHHEGSNSQGGQPMDTGTDPYECDVQHESGEYLDENLEDHYDYNSTANVYYDESDATHHQGNSETEGDDNLYDGDEDAEYDEYDFNEYDGDEENFDPQHSGYIREEHDEDDVEDDELEEELKNFDPTDHNIMTPLNPRDFLTHEERDLLVGSGERFSSSESSSTYSSSGASSTITGSSSNLSVSSASDETAQKTDPPPQSPIQLPAPSIPQSMQQEPPNFLATSASQQVSSPQQTGTSDSSSKPAIRPGQLSASSSYPSLASGMASNNSVQFGSSGSAPTQGGGQLLAGFGSEGFASHHALNRHAIATTSTATSMGGSAPALGASLANTYLNATLQSCTETLDHPKPPISVQAATDRTHQWLETSPSSPITPEDDMRHPPVRTTEEGEQMDLPISGQDEVEAELIPACSLTERDVPQELLTPRYIRTKYDATMDHLAEFIHQRVLEDMQTNQSDFDADPVPTAPRPQHFYVFSRTGGHHIRKIFLHEGMLTAQRSMTQGDHLVVFYDTEPLQLGGDRQSVLEDVVPHHFLALPTV